MLSAVTLALGFTVTLAGGGLGPGGMDRTAWMDPGGPQPGSGKRVHLSAVN